MDNNNSPRSTSSGFGPVWMWIGAIAIIVVSMVVGAMGVDAATTSDEIDKAERAERILVSRLSTLQEVVVSDAVTCVVLFDHLNRPVSLECVNTNGQREEIEG